MTQLQVYDAAGNVRYLPLPTNKPVLVGTSPKCDVVLGGEGINRVHCRIVWREGSWRVEVATDAPGVLLGGRSVMAAKLRPGDEIGIGPCRIILEEVAEGGPEFGPVAEEPVEPLADLVDLAGAASAVAAATEPAKKPLLAADLQPPGEEAILSSRFVQILLICITVIAALALYFYYDFRTRMIQELYDRAVAEKDKGNWVGAIDLFGRFVEQYPRHKYASAAKVYRSICQIEQAAIASPAKAYDEAKETILKLSKEAAWSDAVPTLGATLRHLARNQAEVAKSAKPLTCPSGSAICSANTCRGQTSRKRNFNSSNRRSIRPERPSRSRKSSKAHSLAWTSGSKRSRASRSTRPMSGLLACTPTSLTRPRYAIEFNAPTSWTAMRSATNGKIVHRLASHALRP